MQISASGNPFLSFLPLFIYLFKAVFLLPKKKFTVGQLEDSEEQKGKNHLKTVRICMSACIYV